MGTDRRDAAPDAAAGRRDEARGARARPAPGWDAAAAGAAAAARRSRRPMGCPTTTNASSRTWRSAPWTPRSCTASRDEVGSLAPGRVGRHRAVVGDPPRREAADGLQRRRRRLVGDGRGQRERARRRTDPATGRTGGRSATAPASLSTTYVSQAALDAGIGGHARDAPTGGRRPRDARADARGPRRRAARRRRVGSRRGGRDRSRSTAACVAAEHRPRRAAVPALPARLSGSVSKDDRPAAWTAPLVAAPDVDARRAPWTVQRSPSPTIAVRSSIPTNQVSSGSRDDIHHAAPGIRRTLSQCTPKATCGTRPETEPPRGAAPCPPSRARLDHHRAGAAARPHRAAVHRALDRGEQRRVVQHLGEVRRLAAGEVDQRRRRRTAAARSSRRASAARLHRAGPRRPRRPRRSGRAPSRPQRSKTSSPSVALAVGRIATEPSPTASAQDGRLDVVGPGLELTRAEQQERPRHRPGGYRVRRRGRRGACRPCRRRLGRRARCAAHAATSRRPTAPHPNEPRERPPRDVHERHQTERRRDRPPGEQRPGRATAVRGRRGGRSIHVVAAIPTIANSHHARSSATPSGRPSDRRGRGGRPPTATPSAASTPHPAEANGAVAAGLRPPVRAPRGASSRRKASRSSVETANAAGARSAPIVPTAEPERVPHALGHAAGRPARRPRPRPSRRPGRCRPPARSAAAGPGPTPTRRPRAPGRPR